MFIVNRSKQTYSVAILTLSRSVLCHNMFDSINTTHVYIPDIDTFITYNPIIMILYAAFCLHLKKEFYRIRSCKPPPGIP